MTAKQDRLQLIQSTIEFANQLNNRNDANMLSSFLSQRQRKKLSERQENFLQVLAERNSPKAIQVKQDAQSEWISEWLSNSEFREKAKVIAEYCLRTGYFRDIAMGVKDWRPDNGVVLPPKYRIERMVNSKYAQNVWRSHTTLPLWAVGDMVTLRASLKGIKPTGFRGDMWLSVLERPIWSKTSFMVIAVDHRPIDKALTYNKTSGGTRYYKLLPVGMAQTIDVIECDIKKLLKKQTQ